MKTAEHLLSQNLYPGDSHSLILDGLEAISADFRSGHSVREPFSTVESPIVLRALKAFDDDDYTVFTESKRGTLDLSRLKVELAFGSFQNDLNILMNQVAFNPIIVYRDYSFIKGPLLYLTVSE